MTVTEAQPLAAAGADWRPELEDLFQRQRAAFAAAGAPDLGARRAALKRL